MVNPGLLEQELAAGEAAWKDGRGDAMEHLRQIQRHASLPLPVRQAAERLSTTMPRRYAAPFTSDPLADARVIIEYLGGNTSADP